MGSYGRNPCDDHAIGFNQKLVAAVFEKEHMKIGIKVKILILPFLPSTLLPSAAVTRSKTQKPVN